MQAENLNLKLRKLELTKFTTFADLSLEFSEGINVVIGENSSGKTHLMKLLFSILKGIQPSEVDLELAGQQEMELLSKLKATFKPDTLGRLANRGGPGRSKAQVVLTAEIEGNPVTVCNFSFATNSKKLEVQELLEGSPGVSTLFIPPVEMLTLSEGFMAAYKSRETAYDYTYYALAEALDAKPARGPKEAMAKALVAPILEALDISVSKQEGKFYIKFKGSRAGNVEAALAAEGLKKMGQLLYLINNGSLSNNSILFWDEPEAHLNPRYIEIAVELLRVLASHGVQIFVSTHDYLLSQRLSLMAEQANTDTPSIQFISLYYDREIGSSVAEAAPTLAEISRNPILDEFAKYAGEEASRSWDEF